MKIQAAIYADGSTAGVPEKVAQFIERRRFLLATTRELIGRMGKAHEKPAAIADLRQWADSLRPVGKVKLNSQPVINQTAARSLVSETAASLEAHSIDETLRSLHASEQAFAASKPAL
jgi:hypothetical protein